MRVRAWRVLVKKMASGGVSPDAMPCVRCMCYASAHGNKRRYDNIHMATRAMVSRLSIQDKRSQGLSLGRGVPVSAVCSELLPSLRCLGVVFSI